MKQVLITGGAGFVGYHLAELLSRDPATRVLLVDNFQRGRADEDFAALCRRPNVASEQLDLTRPVDCQGFPLAFEYDEIYHLAAVNGTAAFYERPADVLTTNLLSMFPVLEMARRARGRTRILFASSNEAYAGLDKVGALTLPTPEGVPLMIEDTYNPRWSYAGSKLAGELLMIAHARQFGIPAVIVRPHNFYGPRAGYGHVIPQMLERIRDRADPFTVYGAKQTRSFCYIADAVDAMVRAMALATPACPTFHIGVGEAGEISMIALARLLFATAGWTPERIAIEPAPAGSVRRRVPDIRKITEATGWLPTTSLAAGLAATMEWYFRQPRPNA